MRSARPLFAPPARRKQAEPIVPMINVVFLLLIFFLMTAQIAPPDPFEIDLPEANGDPADRSPQALYLSRAGEVAYGTLRGKDALRAAAQTTDVVLHADAQADAQTLARVLTELSQLGAQDLSLITQEPAR